MDVRIRLLSRWQVISFICLVSFVLMLIFELPAIAQGTPQQRAACEGDAMRLCSEHVPDVNRITSCLSRKRSSLSAACRAVFDGSSKRRRD